MEVQAVSAIVSTASRRFFWPAEREFESVVPSLADSLALLERHLVCATVRRSRNARCALVRVGGSADSARRLLNFAGEQWDYFSVIL